MWTKNISNMDSSNPATTNHNPHNHSNDNEEKVIVPTSGRTENCNLPLPTAPNSLKTVTDSIRMSNQETELLAAMMSEEVAAKKAVASTATSSSSSSSAALAAAITTDASNGNGSTTTTTTSGSVAVTADVAAAAAASSLGSSNQFVTPQKVSEYKSIVLHQGGSASAQQPQKKKKRNKSSKCLGIASMHDHDSSSSLSNIKTSLSMTSLPPDEKQESRDGINAKLKVERPYNSLKKNTDRNLTNQLAHMHRAGKSHGGGAGNSGSSSNTNSNKHNRYSWGSGHSSSSLHSSAATLGIGSGKDDLWAAIQTNYNYIMDTNLLDTCKEARCEIEGATSVLDNTTDTCFKMLDDNSRNVGSCEDPKELRKWLRDMEHKMENAPTLSEATMLTCAELQSHLTEHSVLYHEIVSHARIVSACIRAASEKEQQQKLQQQQQQHQQQQQLLQQQQHDSDASLIAEQTNSSLSSTDDTATTSSGIVCCSSETKLPSSPTGSNTANSSTGGSIAATYSKKSESNWDRLQNRYHLLYLKAFEVQLWLDGLLRKKSSSVGNSTNEDLDSEDIDDLIDSSDDCLDGANDHAVQQVDGGATEDDLNDVASDLESDITHNSLSYNDDDLQQQQLQLQQSNSNKQHHRHHHQQHNRCISDIDNEENVSSHRQQHQHQHHHHSHPNSHLQTSSARDCIQTKIDCEHEGDDEEDEDDDDDDDYNDNDIDEDEIDSPQHRKSLGYTKLLVTFDRSSGRSSSAATHYRAQLTLTDFEADSESSDFETIQQRIRNQRSVGNCGKGAAVGVAAATFSKYLVAHGKGSNGNFQQNIGKRYCNNSIKTAATTTAVLVSGGNSIAEAQSSQVARVNNNTSELEDCETHDMQTKTAVVASETVVNAMVNDHLHQQLKVLQQQQQQQQQQQHHQRLTLMAITQNTMMTTGSSATLASAATSSTTSSTATSSNGSNSNISSNTSSLSGSRNPDNIMLQHKLSSNENNQQHHQQHHPHPHSHLLNGGGVVAGVVGGAANIANGSSGGAAVGAVGLGMKQKNIAIISPNNSHSGNKSHHHHHHHHNSKGNNSNKSPTVLRKHLEHHHSADISKFNRSNRKSKNCAIFYFKHLDTDNETNYSNSICGDDVVHDATNIVGGDGGGGALSSSAASSHASDLLKSADVSSDDEGWLYTSVPAAAAQQQQHSVVASLGGIESLNSNHISRGISASSEFYSSATIQSATVSSSTSTCSTAAIQGDDSDKENKEAKSTSIAKIHLTTTNTSSASATFVATTTVLDAEDHSAATSKAVGSTSSSSIISSRSSASSSSSNDMLTEATTTTASIKTNATQIRQKQLPQLQRSEIELQNNNNHYSSNKSAASMQHIAMNNINNNNSCANSPSSITTTGTHSLDKIIGSSHNNRSGGNNNNVTATKRSSPQHQQQKHHHARNSSFSDDAANGNLEKENMRFYTRADICNINVKSNDNHQHTTSALVNVSPTAASHPLYAQQLHANVGKRLPPRSPAKSSISQTSTNTSSSTISPTKGKVSHESIKQLVLEAEHLVRDEALKTPTKQQQQHNQHQYHQKHSTNNGCGGGIVQITSTIKKREVKMPGPIKRVQEWLEHQPSTTVQLKSSHSHDHTTSPTSTATSPARTDDCEASGEASETDSIPQHCSDDTSEGFTDSIATCMQTSTNSYGNSTERIGGSAEPIVVATSNQSLNVKVIKRHQQTRRKSERPWSVSCLSQLTTDAKQVAAKVCTITNVQSGLASHSISESALDSLSPGRPRASSTAAQVKSYDSKGSLKKRKTRKKKHYNVNGKKSDTNSEDNHHHHHQHQEVNKHPQGLIIQSCESMTPQQIQEITQALMQLQSNGSSEQLTISTTSGTATTTTTNESGEEENHLMKPNFRVGSFTTAYMTNEARLGSLAALATYMNDEEQQGGEYTTGTEDHHSSFSETAWDNYQEKYNSENYSEGFDSDAARKLLEFGDDYRNFIDSQSDCCSSLSAANNLDSFSPPRMDSLQQNESKIIITQDAIVSSVDHARRRRALELEYERRRKNLETRRKSCQESLEYHNPKSPSVTLSSSTQALTPKNPERFHFQQHKVDSSSRKLEFGMSHSAQSLRRTSESDTSQRRRKADERRRSSRNLEKCIKLIPATSSSSGDDSDDEKEIRNLLQQSHNRLEDTKALKIRCHLLRPEDYTEIINTCRDNIRCLESVLKGPSSSVLSSQCVTQSKDLLAAWEDLLGWSENAAAARKMQEDMIVLKHALNRLGNKSSFELLDTEPSIQIAIEALKNEKTTLQTYRTNMLKLNATVHSWLTKQERRLQNALVEQQLKEAAAKVDIGLLEEKDELESEHSNKLTIATSTTTSSNCAQEQKFVEPDSTTISNKTTMITVTDSNGNQVESHTAASTTTATIISSTTLTTTSSVGTCTSVQKASTVGEKNWDLQSLITSENEFHKHLKDEVSDMYTAWDEADLRINSQLEVLTSSLIAWRQLECGLSEFQLALGQDRGTLKGLEGALNTGQTTPGELAQNVKLVAKLLSEKVNVSQEQLTAVQDYLDPNHILHIAKFTASNGSLSDSGISDGGTTSDGGLSERERRLGVLRRLAKQLESALAPGSEAMKSIAARMESAEAELKSLQNTCRDLIVRTAASHQSKKQQQQDQSCTLDKKDDVDHKPLQLQHSNGCLKHQLLTNGKVTQAGELGQQLANSCYTSSSGGRRNKRKPRRNSDNGSTNAVASADMTQSNALQMTAPDGGDDPSDDPSMAYDLDSSDDEHTAKSKRGWAWRIARVAVPMQLALFTVFCAACLMQPNCCDNINNLSMSFTPQLRYIRGPPPI